MQIETYEIEEVKGELGNMAADSEAIELIGKLELDGQQKLTCPDTATRFPYPRLSATQAVVFGTLFPQKTSVRSYSQGIIPLRVLQVIAFCKDMPQTKCLRIWHAASVKEDPVLVGSTSEYSNEEYLLARWGDSLLPFDALKEKALPLITNNLTLDLSKAKQKLDSYTATVKELAQRFMETGERPTWNIYD